MKLLNKIVSKKCVERQARRMASEHKTSYPVKTHHKKLPTGHYVFGALMLSLFASCSMVNEDLEECGKYFRTNVNFVYDYNMQREDLFNEHAGTAHLYVFDEDGLFLFDRSLSRTDMDPTAPVDFTMSFGADELLPGKKYQLVAMAQGNHAGYEASLETPGFVIPLQYEMIPGVSTLSTYRVMLDRDSDSYADIGIINYKDTYGNTRQMMDTLWSTKPGQIQKIQIPEIKKMTGPQTLEVNIPMMRITNSLKVNLLHSSLNENSDPNKFNILVDFPYGNGTISFTGETLPNRELFYQSIRKEITLYNNNTNNPSYDSSTGTRASSYAIEATFGLSRLQTTDGSSLQIRDGATNEILFQLGSVNGKSFSQYLADAFNSIYGDQEFLDREYQFNVDIQLRDDMMWDWYQIGCSVLGWAVRVYNYDVK